MTVATDHTRLYDALITTEGRFGDSLPKGFRFEDTGAHGYYHIDSELERAIPEYLQRGRYEEDCDWAIPVFFNRHLFTRERQQQAIRSLAVWQWEAFERVTGLTLLPGESYIKDEELEYQANTGREFVAGAWGDWREGVPAGMVYVETQIAGTRDPESMACNSEDRGNSYIVQASLYKDKLLR